MTKLYILLLSVFSLSAYAAEETLDFDKVEAPKPAAPAHTGSASKFSLMGRVDLTSEFTNATPAAGSTKNSLNNYHFFIFLKVKASEKTSFMGEIAQRSFFHVDYKALDFMTVQFGDIIVPFGDTRKFHHFYGGIQGYGSVGVMFPNIWSEPGLNLEWKFGESSLDTYVVNSIKAADAVTDPSLQSSGLNRQAAGARLTVSTPIKITGILSGYVTEYWTGRNLILAGLDLYSDYGAMDFVLFKNIRFAAGFANAYISKAPVSGDFEKSGDFVELATNLIGSGELRTRYGTYVDNSKTESANDKHNFNVGYIFSIDVLRILAEYQWNYEAVTETDNDIARVMVSLDF